MGRTCRAGTTTASAYPRPREGRRLRRPAGALTPRSRDIHQAGKLQTQDLAGARRGQVCSPALQKALEGWSLEGETRAMRALRGVDALTAVTALAELGDLTRFDSPRQLMAFVGLVPCEHSSGSRQKRGAITKAGNAHVRRVLVEGAWCYRFPARKTAALQRRAEKTHAKITPEMTTPEEVDNRRYISVSRRRNMQTLERRSIIPAHGVACAPSNSPGPSGKRKSAPGSSTGRGLIRRRPSSWSQAPPQLACDSGLSRRATGRRPGAQPWRSRHLSRRRARNAKR